jgi:hypothetical protein
MTDDPFDHPDLIGAECTILGPVGWWRWQYRVVIRDVGHYDGPCDWTVGLQRKRGGAWFTVDGIADGERVELYPEGRDAEPINDRTEPSESEQALLDDLSKYFP